MNPRIRLLFGAAALLAAAQASAEIRLFENDNFNGRSVTVNDSVRDLNQYGFNDRASSVVVRGGPWVLCQDARFTGACVTLRPGRYPSLSAMGLNDRVSSARRVGGRERR